MSCGSGLEYAFLYIFISILYLLSVLIAVFLIVYLVKIKAAVDKIDKRLEQLEKQRLQ